MADSYFPDDLCQFMQRCTPSVEAVELLLLLARSPRQTRSSADLAHALRPTVVGESVVRDYLNAFATCGLVEKHPGNMYAYSQPREETARLVAALEKAYNEKPVSLVRLIYALKDKKIRSFADAFKLRKD